MKYPLKYPYVNYNFLLVFSVSCLLYLHAEQLQQRCEDAHVVKQEDVVSGPVEHIHLCVTLIKHTWQKKWGGNETQTNWLSVV